MELFPKEATGLERDIASLPGPATEWQTVYPFSFTILPSEGWAFQKLIILLFYPNNNCPSSAPLINKLESESGSTLKHDTDIHAPGLCRRTREASVHLPRMSATRGKWDNLFLLVIDHFDVAVLLNPKLTDDDIVDTTSGVCPSVGFIISVGTNMKKVKV